MTTVDEFFSETLPPADPLRDELINMIKARNDATPRHLQRELGPSEVGHLCMRKMAYGMMETPRCNPQYDPLPSIIGTAVHKWLESAAAHANNQLGRQRWLIETRVNVAAGLSGSCDLYDRDNAIVIDYKCPGANQFKLLSKEMSTVYRNQVHLYGLGYENAGLPVKEVAVALLPRGGTLSGMHLWREEYSRERAQGILKRREAVMVMLNDFRVEIDPSRFELFPKYPDGCMWCPWFKPDPRSPIQCNGKADSA
jgi:hypothetical protein